MNATNAIPVVGTQLAYGIGFLMLLLVVFTGTWAGSLVTVAHEGGHYAVAAFAFRGPKGFGIKDNGNASTGLTDGSWGVGDILLTFAGYATPSLLGLGGAVLIAHGNALGVLWISLVLFIATFFMANNTLANVVTLGAVIGVGWVAYAGTTTIRVAVAVGLVWLMLLGGVRDTFLMDRGKDSDADFLARRTLVPRIAWQGIWIFVAIVCLVRGARLILFH